MRQLSFNAPLVTTIFHLLTTCFLELGQYTRKTSCLLHLHIRCYMTFHSSFIGTFVTYIICLHIFVHCTVWSQFWHPIQRKARAVAHATEHTHSLGNILTPEGWYLPKRTCMVPFRNGLILKFISGYLHIGDRIHTLPILAQCSIATTKDVLNNQPYYWYYYLRS